MLLKPKKVNNKTMQDVYKNRLFGYGRNMDVSSPFTMQICGRIYNPSSWAKFPFYLTNRIYYILGGKAFYKKRKQLKQGYIYIFPADPKFTLVQDAKNPVDHVFFDFLSYEKMIIDDFIEIDASTIPGIKELFLSAGKTFTSRDEAYKFGPHYFELIIMLLREHMPVRQYHSPVTQSAIQCIHESKIEELSVKAIAEKISINEDHLIRCFRKDTGYTPHRYISLYKVDVATSMIRRGSTMKQIADVHGFSSISAFSTFYKNERRVTPSSVKIL